MLQNCTSIKYYRHRYMLCVQKSGVMRCMYVHIKRVNAAHGVYDDNNNNKMHYPVGGRKGVRPGDE